MKNIELVYDHVVEKKVDIKKLYKGRLILTVQEEVFDSTSLNELACYFKCLLRYKFLNSNIIIYLKSCRFKDKITYIILESLIYHLLTHSNYIINIAFKDKKIYNEIHNNKFWKSALFIALDKFGRLEKSKFISEYTKSIILNDTLYRRYLTIEQLGDSKMPSQILTEIRTTLKVREGYEKLSKDVAIIISELVCNVASHAEGECIIDIDFSDLQNGARGLNIGFINFNSETIYNKIQTFVKQEYYNLDDPIYKDVYKAYNIHKKSFDEQYTEEHFFLLTAFQNHVTTRRKDSVSNGTGLATLIKRIVGKVDRDYSYILSGNKVLGFIGEYLEFSDGFIGFNEEKDYINIRPAKKVIDKSNFYIPGTVYQLVLITEE